jgi:flagellar basal-body rod protein FlgC
MKITPNFSAFNTSAKGMSIQKKRMEMITENIANTSTTRTEDGTPYKRKFLTVKSKSNFGVQFLDKEPTLKLKKMHENHLTESSFLSETETESEVMETKETEDKSAGELVYMPDHPDANEDGYVQMPNVSVVTEMVDMIAASRSYEANLTAFNAAKQIAKDSLEI